MYARSRALRAGEIRFANDVGRAERERDGNWGDFFFFLYFTLFSKLLLSTFVLSLSDRSLGYGYPESTTHTENRERERLCVE